MPAACLLSPAADAINNAAGFGFSGYDVDGSPQWDMISNLRIMDIEVWLFKKNCLTHSETKLLEPV